jgi:hypothetical protein
MADQPNPRRVVSPQPGAPFTGPAYEYIVAADRIPRLGGQGNTDHAAIVWVKLLIPGSRWTLFICEHDPIDQLVWGWVASPLGADCDEWGYNDLNEIAALRAPFGTPPERDLAFTRAPLWVARQQHARLTEESRE